MQLLNEFVKAPITLEIDEFPENFDVIAEKIGIDEACSLLWYMAPFEIRSIPNKQSKLMKYQIIKDEFDGGNALSLAVKLNMDAKKVKKIAALFKDSDIHIDVRCNDDMGLIGEMCGDIVSYKLLKFFPGQSINKKKKGFNLMIKKLIVKGFNGGNHTELSIKYRVCVSHVYRVLREENRVHIKTEQTNLFKGV